MTRNLKGIFEQFAQQECHNSSPLYEQLSYAIAQDEAILRIAAQIPKEQPIPNLLFASVQYLLMTQEHPLRAFYPRFTDFVQSPMEAFPHFKDFVLTHTQELAYLFATKRVQTNEVRRCAYLYPMLCDIFEQHKKPLALIEVGTSAGLQLGIDHYQFRYGDTTVGDQTSSLTLQSDNRGESLPKSIAKPFEVATRIGIDLRTMNVNEEEDLDWLKALIWPEHTDRLQLLNQAVHITRELPIQLVDGDATKKLQHIATQVPEEEMLVIFHTYVANQFSPEAKMNLMQSLIAISKTRPVYHIYNNLYDEQLHQDFLHEHQIEEIRRIDQAESHARWFKWKN
ncbi:MAG TPA: DUF2332 domain-containing protein [Kurthia gibsonii]|nr:DUF2332 domain-containing protein [Kurthia gibsonii]